MTDQGKPLEFNAYARACPRTPSVVALAFPGVSGISKGLLEHPAKSYPPAACFLPCHCRQTRRVHQWHPSSRYCTRLEDAALLSQLPLPTKHEHKVKLVDKMFVGSAQNVAASKKVSKKIGPVCSILDLRVLNSPEFLKLVSALEGSAIGLCQ